MRGLFVAFVLTFVFALFEAPAHAVFDHNMGDHMSVLDIAPIADVLATSTSTGVDLKDYQGQIAFVLDGHKVAGTNPTMDIKVQDSADNSSFADVSGLAFTQLTTANSVQKMVTSKDALRRYVRVIQTIGGTSNPEYLLSVKAYAAKKYLP